MSRCVHRGHRVSRVVQWTAALAALALLAGCGGAPFDIVPVKGKVTYQGGEPIPGHRVEISFYPQVEKKGAEHAKEGNAILNEDGTFDYATTWKHGDGLIVGKHKVTVQALDENEVPTAAVPNKYRSPKDTPLEIEVTGGELEPIEIDKP